MTDPRAITRLEKRIAQRDRRIAGLKRRVAQLEDALASKALNGAEIEIDVRRAVQDALCNVRMIPVLGVGRNARIMEVRTYEQEDGV